ncbi:efflux RND transporter periplasmic adaptor subunit [Microbulbifer discodermiae]|uniref:efflux RND transporter periplasmic adaptor subunit n=1 Tax=Microbulbifer sp. 2201CG32-9 TaxID=3232309 RepID=UPI00345B6A01
MKIPGNKRFFCAALALTVLSGCFNSGEETEQVERQWPVKVVTVSGDGNVSQRQFAGRVRAVQTVDLSFQVRGRLEKLDFREGEIIPEGTVIATLDDRDYQRKVEEARVNLELLQKTVSRQQALAKRKVIAEQQFDEAETRFKLAQVALENAQQDLAYTRLTVPFDALVTRKLVDSFTNVQRGQAIVRVQNVSEVRIQVSVPGKLLATVNAERIASISAVFESLPGQEFPLEYREHEAEADSVTQTYIVELGMPRPKDTQILPGMTARVIVALKPAQSALWIPLSAVQTGADGAAFVWQINGDQSVSQAAVELGVTDGDMVQVITGLRPSMQLVAAGGQHLYEGARVRNYAQQSAR